MHAQHGGAVGHGIAQVPARHREAQAFRGSKLVRRDDPGGPRMGVAAGRASLAAERATERESEGTGLQALDLHDGGGGWLVVIGFCPRWRCRCIAALRWTRTIPLRALATVEAEKTCDITMP